MSESVFEGALNLPSAFASGDGCFSAFSNKIPSSNCRFSFADSLLSAFQSTNATESRTSVDASFFYSEYSIPRRPNSVSTAQQLHPLRPQKNLFFESSGKESQWAVDSTESSLQTKLTNANAISSLFTRDDDPHNLNPLNQLDCHLPLSRPTLTTVGNLACVPQSTDVLKVEQTYDSSANAAEFSSQLDEQLSIFQSQEKQPDFLQKIASTINPHAVGSGSTCTTTTTETKLTMTERIYVPTSDHVAEIVGKNGQRIRHLREQLKVWVKTPARDEPPVFEITGMPEKLGEAKRIILQMSEHFSKVQQERLSRIEPNRTEDRLYVEQDKVGLIVGASGQTIRWVQQLSDTHIATPRKQESIPGLPSPQTHFTICGTRERVRFAKQLICEYVSLRCQGLWLDPELESSPEASQLVHDFHARRQAEDTQRRGSAPAGVTLTSLSQLSGTATADDPAAAALPQSLAEVKRLWQEGGPPPAFAGWDGVLFGGLPPTSVPPPPPMSLIGDRRYSVDAPSVAQHHRQQQQQSGQQQQRQFLFGLDLDGLDQLSKVKSYSDDLVLQAGSGINGWM